MFMHVHVESGSQCLPQLLSTFETGLSLSLNFAEPAPHCFGSACWPGIPEPHLSPLSTRITETHSLTQLCPGWMLGPHTCTAGLFLLRHLPSLYFTSPLYCKCVSLFVLCSFSAPLCQELYILRKRKLLLDN